MRRSNIIKIQLAALILLSVILSGCMASAKERYFGRTAAPEGNTLRYISGSEPESLDPQVGTGQPEARIYMSLYEGLVEYDPKTMDPVPELATNWDISKDGLEYLFHLRKDAKWSNGDPITAKDFAFSFRRGFSPEVASRNANLGFYIKYTEAYNNSSFFMKNEKGEFLQEKDFAESTEDAVTSATDKSVYAGPETEFAMAMRAPARLIINGDALKRAQQIQGNEKIKTVFKFTAKDIKNPVSLAGKINNGKDAVSQFVKANVPKDALDACAAEASCGEAQKQSLADGLNKLADSQPVYDAQRFDGITLSKGTQGLIGALNAENKKRVDANAAIDEDIAQTADPTKKEEKAKGKKKPVGNLFYLNRSVLEDVYKDEFAAPNMVAITAEDIGVEAVDDYTFRVTLTQPADRKSVV